MTSEIKKSIISYFDGSGSKSGNYGFLLCDIAALNSFLFI
jgi:hypothetical protein